ncbi:MAG: PCMD domain-containing protein [Bacteroidaceae bacterium]|nr:PCMD domain-containing protein [Bacteroidaceae bacterium]
MKLKELIFIATGLLVLTSCIRKEAPNQEADILRCILPAEILADKSIDYSLPFDTELKAYPIYIEVKGETNLSNLAPQFELSTGATIQPASGSYQDFTSPVYYTVTSESGTEHRPYAIIIRYKQTEQIPTDYHFEHVELYDNYYIFYEETDNDGRFTWASGNPGYALTGKASSPYDFPTTISPDGYIGHCAKLTTLLTGSLGEKVGKPIAAGNLFMGKFELLNALGDALSATKFGVPFYHRPTQLTGYFKYQSGPQFYEDGKYTSNKKDTFSIYALFYEKTNEMPFMDGHLPANHFESPNMVALAQLDKAQTIETEVWTYFEIPFDYTRYNLPVDTDKQQNGEYYLSIVFASSKDGDEFRGAPGSTLMIDEVKLIYE